MSCRLSPELLLSQRLHSSFRICFAEVINISITQAESFNRVRLSALLLLLLLLLPAAVQPSSQHLVIALPLSISIQRRLCSTLPFDPESLSVDQSPPLMLIFPPKKEPEGLRLAHPSACHLLKPIEKSTAPDAPGVDSLALCTTRTYAVKIFCLWKHQLHLLTSST